MKNMWLTIPMIALLVSCGQDEVQTYQVPKEKTAVPTMQGAAPQSVAQMPAAPAASAGFTANLPAGWNEVPSDSAMRRVSYGIDGTAIDFYLISLSVGDLPSNVNRWRGQVGLPVATAAEIEAATETFKIDHHSVKYIEILNEEGGQGIVAAIVDLAPSYWYFTGKGTVDELKAHTSDMRAFLESVKFEGHNH